MRMLLGRRVRIIVVAGAALVLLTGCVKLDVDLTVGDNDTVSGTYIVAVDRSVLQLTGQDADQLYNQLASDFDTADLPEGASADIEKYDQDNFVGAEITVKDVPISEINNLGGTPAADSTSTFTLTHDGDLYHFRAVIDTSSSAAGESPISVPDQVTNSAELRVKMTFPGEVTETNGAKSGTSVTWEPKLGTTADLTATANDSGGSSGGGGGGGGNRVLVIIAVIAGLALVAVVLISLLARSRRETAPPPPEPPSGPPPGLGTLGTPPPPAPSPFAPPTPPTPAPASAAAPPATLPGPPAAGRPLPPPPA